MKYNERTTTLYAGGVFLREITVKNFNVKQEKKQHIRLFLLPQVYRKIFQLIRQQ